MSRRTGGPSPYGQMNTCFWEKSRRRDDFLQWKIATPSQKGAKHLSPRMTGQLWQPHQKLGWKHLVAGGKDYMLGDFKREQQQLWVKPMGSQRTMWMTERERMQLSGVLRAGWAPKKAGLPQTCCQWMPLCVSVTESKSTGMRKWRNKLPVTNRRQECAGCFYENIF